MRNLIYFDQIKTRSNATPRLRVLSDVDTLQYDEGSAVYSSTNEVHVEELHYVVFSHPRFCV